MTRPPERPDHRHIRHTALARVRRPALTAARALGLPLTLGALLALALSASLAPAAAEAVPALEWSKPKVFDTGRTPSAVSCASESLCVAVDHKGDALSTSDPTAEDASWSRDELDPGESLNAVSCVPGGPCVAVDGHGDAFVSVGADASAWSPAMSIPDGGVLTGVSCPTASLCVAVDEEGKLATSTSPESGDWTTAASIDAGHALTAVSCSSQSLCVAVDDAGDVLRSVEPTGGVASWHSQRVDFGGLPAVSCWAAGACVAADGAGDALASTDPGASPATWSVTPIDGEPLTGVSCASSGLCVAVDGRGEALASDDPAETIPSWPTSSPSPDSQPLAGVSCLPGGFCMAVDTAGDWLAARVEPPYATTLTPTEVTDASATLTGAVDPNDAVLGACSFEYGAGGVGALSSQSIPCSVLPAAIGGPQDVSAELSGLSPNATYHYRVLASSPRGARAGEEVAFTTAVSAQVALVYPYPSITGTPAAGQPLTCHPGTPAGAAVQLSYAWLRDLIPIAGATGSTYTVKGQDTGHHLQCQVTVTDGGGSATAKSAFVTIPVEGAPASAGETTVGTASFKSGKVSVPIACSTLANGGCHVALRLTAVETLSGGRIVAISARAKRTAHRSAAAVRHVTINLASVRVHLAPGAHTAISAILNTTGRRLLASKRRFTSYLYVSGTVIGVIEAQLAQRLVTLTAPPRGASTHAARRR
jgi:hypothetical protein